MAAFTALAILVDKHFALVDVVDAVVLVMGLVGLFGFSYKRKLATRNIWQTFTIFAISYHYLYSFILDRKYGGTPGDTLLTAILPLPIFIGLILYSFKSKI